MSFTDRTTGRGAGKGAPDSLASIPLSDLDPETAEASIGALVKNATSQVSTLVRSEVELAKTEVTAEVKKGLQGSVFFIIAAVIALFSTFFFFFFLGELISVWLPRWAAFLIVFGVQILAAAVAGLLGYLRVRKIRKPEKTIDSAKELRSVLPKSGGAGPSAGTPGSTPDAARTARGTSAPGSPAAASTAPAASGGKHAR